VALFPFSASVFAEGLSSPLASCVSPSFFYGRFEKAIRSALLPCRFSFSHAARTELSFFSFPLVTPAARVGGQIEIRFRDSKAGRPLISPTTRTGTAFFSDVSSAVTCDFPSFPRPFGSLQSSWSCRRNTTHCKHEFFFRSEVALVVTVRPLHRTRRPARLFDPFVSDERLFECLRLGFWEKARL